MSLPIDARPGTPGASPRPDQVSSGHNLGIPTEQSQPFGAIYADLESYFWMQLHPPTHESVDYALGDGAELSMLFDIADIDGIDKLLEGTDIQVPIGKFHVPDSGFIRLSDTDQGRIIRFGITFSGESEAQPSENFGIELNLAETDGAVGFYESHTSPDGTPQGKEERLKTEKVLLSPDQMRSMSRIVDKYSPSGRITHRATRRARVDGGMPLEIRQYAEQLRHLAGQDLGVLGVGWGVLPKGGNGLVMMVEEGMPDELKDILAGALPGVKISFQETAAPELYSQSTAVSEQFVDITLDTSLEDIPDQEPCEVCGHPTQKTFLQHVSGLDVLIRARNVAGYRCQDPECGITAYSIEGFVESLTKASQILRDRGDTATATAFERRIEAEQQRIALQGDL